MRPDLRIVSDDQWNAAHARIQRARASQSVAMVDRLVRGRDGDSKYLLAGFARCDSCGGTLSVLTRQHGARRVPFYGCLAHHKRGASVCTNGLVLPVARVDDAVLRAFAGEVLEPAVISVIIDMVFAAMEPDTVKRSVAALKTDLRAIDQKIGNLVTAVEGGGAAVEALVAKLYDRQHERQALLTELATAQAIDQIHANRPEVERKVQAQVAAWRALVKTALVSDGRRY